VASSPGGEFEFSNEADYTGSSLKIVVIKDGFQRLEKKKIHSHGETDLLLNKSAPLQFSHLSVFMEGHHSLSLIAGTTRKLMCFSPSHESPKVGGFEPYSVLSHPHPE
jgi:hypothetical protein